MDERRDPPPTPEPGVPRQMNAPSGELSPVQQARRRYVQHVTDECARCRDVDRDRCDEGERLYRAWIDVCDDAYRQLSDHTQ
ncbi:hypothetical protein [Streptomyces acidicola]|uniref:Uncharacterized protein n=1 Tax=Streptomyces acidicola TaxID=2596892 RepID=A0A5N8WKZ6_9ACTN|nr:hypothetical protein [Streptomyces acidicola]MPY47194.1 hypothetical protein [Streptomyces acidicola]MPY47333.1 hypothetical protein [Streptomyces acidicola]